MRRSVFLPQKQYPPEADRIKNDPWGPGSLVLGPRCQSKGYDQGRFVWSVLPRKEYPPNEAERIERTPGSLGPWPLGPGPEAKGMIRESVYRVCASV